MGLPTLRLLRNSNSSCWLIPPPRARSRTPETAPASACIFVTLLTAKRLVLSAQSEALYWEAIRDVYEAWTICAGPPPPPAPGAARIATGDSGPVMPRSAPLTLPHPSIHGGAPPVADAFYSYLCAYLEGEKGAPGSLVVNPIVTKTHDHKHMFPFCCLKPWSMHDGKFVRYTHLGVSQYSFIQAACAIATFATEYTKTFHDGTTKPTVVRGLPLPSPPLGGDAADH